MYFTRGKILIIICHSFLFIRLSYYNFLNIEYKKQLLIKAIKLKPKKIYIDMLKKITDDFERNELYIKKAPIANIYSSRFINIYTFKKSYNVVIIKIN